MNSVCVCVCVGVCVCVCVCWRETGRVNKAKSDPVQANVGQIGNKNEMKVCKLELLSCSVAVLLLAFSL